ncbi:3'-5' exonuclease [Cystobacter fuscus]|uniref:3'-5' exonuclease n=1 Tax=Cystobacter fuscus TaxID=43 RepID=UPI000971528E|nr:3'-5' exonuclease [Cystobacter fuscus]
MPTATKSPLRSKSTDKPPSPRSRQRTFVAIDFETADYFRDSACAVALVRVEGNKIVAREHHLIQPPRSDFKFTHIHGITWSMVARAPTFDRVWTRLKPLLKGAEFLAAHNAGFDRSVLNACCLATGLKPPTLDFTCSVRLAKQTWALQKASLPEVCKFLNIPLEHHNAMSDAEACARIVLAAAITGGEPPAGRQTQQPASAAVPGAPPPARRARTTR